MQYSETKGSWLITLAQYAAWLVTGIGTCVDALYIREGVLRILTFFQVLNEAAYHQKGGVGIDLQFGFAMTTVDEFVILILGCVAVAAVVAIEYYFRLGRPKGLLFKRIGIVFGVEVGIIVLMIIVNTIF